MENFENEIKKANDAKKLNILKGFVEVEDIQNLSKAKVVGQTKVGADGITRIWVDRGNGTFGWRRQRGEKKTEGSGSAPKQSKSEDKSKFEIESEKRRKKENSNKNVETKNSKKELSSLKKKLGLLTSQSYVEQRKPEKKAQIQKLEAQINEIEKKSTSGDKIQPAGHKTSDAITYGKKLLDSGLKPSEVRNKIELHYPALKQSMNGVMSSVIEKKEEPVKKVKSANDALKEKLKEEPKKKTVTSTVRRYMKIKKDVKTREDKTFSFEDSNKSEWFSKHGETMKDFIERIEPDVKMDKKPKQNTKEQTPESKQQDLRDLKTHLETQSSSGNWDIDHYVSDKGDGKYEITTYVNGKRGRVSDAEKKAMSNKPTLPKGFKFETDTPYFQNGTKEMTHDSIKEIDEMYNRGYTDSEFSGGALWKVIKDNSKKSNDIKKAIEILNL